MGCYCSKWENMTLAQKEQLSSTKTLAERQRLARGETLPVNKKKSTNNQNSMKDEQSAKEQDARDDSSLMKLTSSVISPTVDMPVRGLQRTQPTTNGMGPSGRHYRDK